LEEIEGSEVYMTITKMQDNGKITLALEGRLDTTTSPQLEEAITSAFDASKDVELDFSLLIYVSSAGLRVLLIGMKTAKAKGVEFSLTGVSKEIMEVLEMTGFSDMLKIV